MKKVFLRYSTMFLALAAAGFLINISPAAAQLQLAIAAAD